MSSEASMTMQIMHSYKVTVKPCRAGGAISARNVGTTAAEALPLRPMTNRPAMSCKTVPAVATRRGPARNKALMCQPRRAGGVIFSREAHASTAQAPASTKVQ
jgi:hypothetical protein